MEEKFRDVVDPTEEDAPDYLPEQEDLHPEEEQAVIRKAAELGINFEEKELQKFLEEVYAMLGDLPAAEALNTPEVEEALLAAAKVVEEERKPAL